jgi:hypothetical protein
MKHFYSWFFPVFFIPAFSFAQGNYKPGYVINLKGDTLNGFIDYKEWTKTPRKINFKNSLTDDQQQTYYTGNCKGFEIDGFEYYKRFILLISMDKIELSDLSTGLDTTAVIDTVFLRMVTSGKSISLYSYKDKIKDRYFVDENGSTPSELILHLYLDPQASSKIIITQNIYNGQLQKLAAKYQPGNVKLINEINVSYQEKHLKLIVDKINGIENYTKTIVKKHTGYRFFIGTGLNNTSTEFEKGFDFVNNKPISSIFPQINIGTDFFTNKNIGDLVIRVEFTFTGNKIDYSNNNANGALLYTSTLKYEEFIASLNPQIVYNFYNKNSSKAYFALGLVINYQVFSNKSFAQSYLVANDYITTPLDFPDIKRPFGLSSKAGFVLSNRFDFYFGYNPTITVNNYAGYSFATTQFKAGINYLFGLK